MFPDTVRVTSGTKCERYICGKQCTPSSETELFSDPTAKQVCFEMAHIPSLSQALTRQKMDHTCFQATDGKTGKSARAAWCTGWNSVVLETPHKL